MARARVAARPKHHGSERSSHPDVSAALIDELRWLRAEYAELKTKCARLELAVMSQYPAGRAFADRTDEVTERPPITAVGPKKLSFAELRAKWDQLSEKEQEQHMAKGDWKPEEEPIRKKKAS